MSHTKVIFKGLREKRGLSIVKEFYLEWAASTIQYSNLGITSFW